MIYMAHLYSGNKYTTGLDLFIAYYMNDILAGVLVVAFFNFAFSFYSVRTICLNTLLTILTFTFICGLFWEYIAPLYKPKSTGDYKDIIAYCCGGIIYYALSKASTHSSGQ